MGIKKTVVVTGPGGVGKSPLYSLFKEEVYRIDPYRLRPNGPRGTSDKLYAPMSLHDNLKSVLEALNDRPKVIRAEQETIEWHPKSKVLFFTVRGAWQCLFLNGAQLANASLAKAEMYAPILVALLEQCDDFKAFLGKIEIIVLNPVQQSLTKMKEWTEVKKVTRDNCNKRGDPEGSIKERVGSVDAEAPAWKRLIENDATEYVGWPFAEYRYPEKGVGRSRMLIQARRRLLEGKPSLREFLRPEAEIRGIR